MPKAMVLGGGALGKWLGHEKGTPMNGISALMKEAPESSLAFYHVRIEFEVCRPEESPHLTVTVYMVISDRQLPELQTMNFCYLSATLYGIV